MNLRQHKILEYKKNLTSPFIAAARGYIDDIIEPQKILDSVFVKQ